MTVRSEERNDYYDTISILLLLLLRLTLLWLSAWDSCICTTMVTNNNNIPVAAADDATLRYNNCIVRRNQRSSAIHSPVTVIVVVFVPKLALNWTIQLPLQTNFVTQTINCIVLYYAATATRKTYRRLTQVESRKLHNSLASQSVAVAADSSSINLSLVALCCNTTDWLHCDALHGWLFAGCCCC